MSVNCPQCVCAVQLNQHVTTYTLAYPHYIFARFYLGHWKDIPNHYSVVFYLVELFDTFAVDNYI